MPRASDNLISEEYKKMNQHLHKDHSNYGNQNHFLSQHLPSVCNALNKHYGYKSILDYGCGKGLIIDSLNKHLVSHTYTVNGYDPCVSQFASQPEPADIVICTDVLEHIEPEKIESVLKHIKDLTGKICYLIIDLLPAQKNLPDGRNAHLIIAHPGWWLNQLGRQFGFGTHFITGTEKKHDQLETKKLVYVGTNDYNGMIPAMNMFTEIHLRKQKARILEREKAY